MHAWVEIDLGTIERNVGRIRERVGRTVGVIAVVKADAYGHGLTSIVPVLDQSGVAMYAVITLAEAQTIRAISSTPVLIIGYLDPKEIVEAITAGFILSLYDPELIPVYERLAQRLNRTVRVHLQIETGLNREGVTLPEAADFLASKRLFPHLHVEAIFSHLYEAVNRETNLTQLRDIQQWLVDLQGKAEILPIHLTSSGALASFPEGYFDAVRVGLALYGVDDVLPGLEPSFSCKSVVMQVKKVPAGQGVSYNHLFRADSPKSIAVIALGYADGLSQALTGKMEVIVDGQIVPVVGQICMNLITADVTGLEVKRGDEVVIIGTQQGKNGQTATIRVAELAKRAGLRHHEIIVRLGQALPRRYLGGEELHGNKSSSH